MRSLINCAGKEDLFLTLLFRTVEKYYGRICKVSDCEPHNFRKLDFDTVQQYRTPSCSPTMDLLRRVTSSNHDNMILLSVDHDIIEMLQGLQCRVLATVEDISRKLEPRAIIFDRSHATTASLQWVHRSFPMTFVVIFDPSSSEDPCFRMKCFDSGANMVSHDVQSLVHTLESSVLSIGRSGGRYSCPYCPATGLTERDLWYHCPAYHINITNEAVSDTHCPICETRTRIPMQVHIHQDHGPHKWSRAEREPVEGITRLYNFSLVMCRHPSTGKFLLCQEFANQGFWCPGGAVDAGELMCAAAKRETMEEAGIDIELKGILSVEYNPIGKDHRDQSFVRLRVVFYAEPSRLGLTQLPKSVPDFESAGACWCSAEEILSKIKLRGGEPRRWVKHLQEGGAIYPLALLEERVS